MSDKESGVTLVETLVALAIMGLVIGAILVLVGQNTRFAAAAQDRFYAAIAADNMMVETLARAHLPDKGQTLGDTSYAGRNWRYRQTISETGVGDISRIDIEILDDDEKQVIASATTLRGDKP